MEIIETGLPGVLLIDPKVFGDNRGWFYEVYSRAAFTKAGIDTEFIQDNHSFSAQRFTLRGIHFQNDPTAQAKLVRCTRGRILDYAVDLRRGSPTYLRWVSAELSAENKRQIFLPRGFGHAFVTLTEDCEVNYKVDNPYSPADEHNIRYDDPTIGITWPEGMEPVLSGKDAAAPLLAECGCNFVYGEDKA